MGLLPITINSPFKDSLGGVDVMPRSERPSELVPNGKDPSHDGVVSAAENDVAYNRSDPIVDPEARLVPRI